MHINGSGRHRRTKTRFDKRIMQIGGGSGISISLTLNLPYVVLREAVSPSYASPTQGRRVWLSNFCRLRLPSIGRPAPHDDSAAN